MNIKAFIQRHPVATYFGMTFMISWVGAFLVVAPKFISGEPISTTDGLLMFPVMLLGPSLTGIALTSIVDGRSGLRDLFWRIGGWRVGARWYAALLIPPCLILSVLLTFRTLIAPAFTPHLFLLGIPFGLAPGFLEEIGWMGYAFPKMQLKSGRLDLCGLFMERAELPLRKRYLTSSSRTEGVFRSYSLEALSLVWS